jgi:hypothetical protein
MKMIKKRLIIYPKDMILITGKSERYCRYLHKKIKAHFNKKDHQAVTIQEFSDYLGLKPEDVSAVIY